MSLNAALQMLLALSIVGDKIADGAYAQGAESDYLANFDSIQSATYSTPLPSDLSNTCRNKGYSAPVKEVTIQAGTNRVVNSANVSNQCGVDSKCIIPIGTIFQVDESIDLAALVVKGVVEWTDSTQIDPIIFMCAGFIAIEEQGKWEMDLQTNDAFIYIKDNGAVHDSLRTRAFGSAATSDMDYPIIDINGRELRRPWSLLSQTLKQGQNTMKLMHNPKFMGWKIGDRIGVAPTEVRAEGHGEEFVIVRIEDDGSILLDKLAEFDHDAEFMPASATGHYPPLFAAEVVNLSRSIVITGDDLKHIDCDSSLPEAVFGEETSTIGCRCSSYRSKCTVGLHTAIMHGGTAKIQNARIEKCGQRGVEGKYCLHFHKLHDCPTCLFKNNAIEGGHQRAIIVHGTHSSTVENNVVYNVRGAGIYIEDGNEMYNDIKYNVVICPFPFADAVMNGCTVPGTSNRLSDTSDNHSGIYSRAFTNSLQGNRVANLFNGMFFNAEGIGRGESYDKVCEADAKFTRIEGNTFHGNGRFGTYVLGFNFPKATDQSILNDGHNVDKSLCSGFDENGYERGLPTAIIDNLDYGNAFVGHYNAGDIQYSGHNSHRNIELIYWKTTKNFANGCSAHILGGDYSHGNMALPDQATFLIEDTVFGDQVSLEANHHCNEGTTGVLCFPQYLFHNVAWKNADMSNQWVRFHYGGIFSLSPPNAQVVMDGGILDDSFFPPGFVSLVSSQYTYLLGLPSKPCVLSDLMSTNYGNAYGGGILCKVPLRALKVYTKGLAPGNAPPLKVDVWYGKGGVLNQVSPPDSTQTISFHQTGSTRKQGYSLPIVPGAEHSYQLSLADGNGDIPTSWVIEFSDFLIGNRFGIEYTNLSLNGRICGSVGLISSHHDRRFIWSGDEFMNENAWGRTGACSTNHPQDFPLVDCSAINNGKLDADECAELCNYRCNNSSSYCDCGSAICKCKPGFSGEDCSTDVCSFARCGEHGTCTAKYLGGDLPVTSVACICDKGWSGALCQFNPCQDSGKTCSGHGSCVAVSDSDAMCQCDPGYSGENCETNCNDFCVGSYPFNCATSVDGIVKYGCDSNGGCMYLADGQEYPHTGFCTYREAVERSQCMCGTENECVKTQSCMPDGSCRPENLPDFTPCNTIPFGICVGGSCLEQDGTKLPTTQPRPGSPTQTPTSKPTIVSTSKSTVISTGSPTQKPTKNEFAHDTCDGFCIGEYPYACASNLPGIVEYGCHQNGGCYYLEDGQFYPHEGFCTFKSLVSMLTPPPSHVPTSTPTHEPTKIALSSRPTSKPTNEFDQNLCQGICIGDYPHGCATSLDGVVLYGCHRNGGCHYLVDGQNYPYEGFCTFKSVLQTFLPPTQLPTSNPTKNPTAKPTDVINQNPCDGICIGDYPYGCATDLVDVVEYGCHHGDGCNYLKAGESYPYEGFCTYKSSFQVQASHPTQNPTPNPTPNPTNAVNQNPCDGICVGNYPYGCATDLVDVVEYGCHHGGGCNYLKAGESYPYEGFCTYKSSLQVQASHPTQNPNTNPTPNPTPNPTNAANQNPCDGICVGNYPYGCATDLVDVVEYGCHHGGGCNYLKAGESYPFAGFCSFKFDV